jgi:hypothetical protein
MSGRTLRCPDCDAEIRVPDVGETPPAVVAVEDLPPGEATPDPPETPPMTPVHSVDTILSYATPKPSTSFDGLLTASIILYVVLEVAALYLTALETLGVGEDSLVFMLSLGAMLLVLIPATIVGCVLLYRWWAILPEGARRTTPGRAVGFCFIPLFNFYWFFVAFYGLTRDVNAYLVAHDPEARRSSAGLALTYSILLVVGFLLCWVPVVGDLIGIAGALVFIPFALSTTKACKAVAAARWADAT